MHSKQHSLPPLEGILGRTIKKIFKIFQKKEGVDQPVQKKTTKPKPAPATTKPKPKAKQKKPIEYEESEYEKEEAPPPRRRVSRGRVAQPVEFASVGSLDRHALASDVLNILQQQRYERTTAKRNHYASWF